MENISKKWKSNSYFYINFILLNKYDNEKKKLEDYLKIIESNQKILEFRTLLIFFDEDNLID